MSVIVLVSGGFDPIHPGHIKLMKEAKKLGDYLIVILNSDEWLVRKKGKFFMRAEQRAEIVENIKPVDKVWVCKEFEDQDNSVCRALELLRGVFPDNHIIFANGGDRGKDNVPEIKTAQDLNIELRWGVGGENKVASSSDLLKNWKG